MAWNNPKMDLKQSQKRKNWSSSPNRPQPLHPPPKLLRFLNCFNPFWDGLNHF